MQSLIQNLKMTTTTIILIESVYVFYSVLFICCFFWGGILFKNKGNIFVDAIMKILGWRGTVRILRQSDLGRPQFENGWQLCLPHRNYICIAKTRLNHTHTHIPNEANEIPLAFTTLTVNGTFIRFTIIIITNRLTLLSLLSNKSWI